MEEEQLQLHLASDLAATAVPLVQEMVASSTAVDTAAALEFSSWPPLQEADAVIVAPAVADEAEGADLTALREEGLFLGELCISAKTVLMLPFSFWPSEDDKESPAFLAEALLRRQVGGDGVALWEPTGLSRDVAELSPHFRELLGGVGAASDGEEDPAAPGDGVQRLRLTDAARQRLFAGARLTADSRNGEGEGVTRACEWADVQLVIFPHGAIVSVFVDWLAGQQQLSLSQLRSWIYLSRFRLVKPGVSQGWSFAAPVADVAPLAAADGVSLAAVADWLVAMPEAPLPAPAVVSRHEACQHHTMASLLDARPPPELDALLFHISKQYGSANRRPPLATGSGYASRFVPDASTPVRSNAAMRVSATGTAAIEWGGVPPPRSFANVFFGVLLELHRHCLSERATLEKLAYLAAVRSYSLAGGPGVGGEGARVRFHLARLASQLLHYRTAMASEDCGGSAEARRTFASLRRVHRVAELRASLTQRLQDAQRVLWCEEEEQAYIRRRRERSWRVRKEGIQLEKESTKEQPKIVFDVLYFAASAILFPLVLVATMFGSNQDSLPRQVRWSDCLIGGAVVAVVLLALFVVLYCLQIPKMRKVEREQRRHASNLK